MAALSLAIASLSLSKSAIASFSASGESGIVSSDEIEGDRDRNDVGVLGTEEALEDKVKGVLEGNASLKRGEAAGDPKLLSVGDEAWLLSDDLRL